MQLNLATEQKCGQLNIKDHHDRTEGDLDVADQSKVEVIGSYVPLQGNGVMLLGT
jgi:hypothetical protein